MSSLSTKRQKANEEITEAILEYAAACHVDNIAEEIDEKNIDDVYYPTELDENMKKLITSYKNRNKRKELWKTGRKIFTKVAVFLFVTILGISILAVSVEAIRIKLYNLAVEVMDEFTSVEIVENVESANNYYDIYMPTYIPEGYRLADLRNYSDVAIVQYIHDEGDTILFEQCIKGQSNLRIDTENAESRKIKIKGNKSEAFIVNKNRMVALVWHDNEMMFTLAGTIDEKELIKIAESLEKK